MLGFTRKFPAPTGGLLSTEPRERVPETNVFDCNNVFGHRDRIRKVPGYIKIGSTLTGKALLINDIIQTNGTVVSVAISAQKLYEFVADWTDRPRGVLSPTGIPYSMMNPVCRPHP